MASWPDSIRCHPHLMGSTPLRQTGLPACLCPSSDQEQLQLTVSLDRPNGPPANNRKKKYHGKAPTRSTMPNALAGYHVFGQVGGYTTGQPHTIGAVTVPWPHPTHASASSPPATSSLSWSPPVTSSASLSRHRNPARNFITREGNLCAYVSLSGVACTQPSHPRHWATTHVLKETKRMRAGEIKWLKGAVIKTEAAFRIAEEYLLHCLRCQGKIYTRRSSLVRHMQSCGSERTRKEAKEIVEGWMPGGEGAEAQALNMLIFRLCELESSRKRWRGTAFGHRRHF